MANFNFKRTIKDEANMLTHEGGLAKALSPKEELLKLCMTSFLEKKYYESPAQTIERIIDYCKKVEPDYILKLSIFSRDYGLRSINHLLAAIYALSQSGTEGLREKLYKYLSRLIKRPDELGEILAAVNFLTGKKVIPSAIKSVYRDLLSEKFDDYQLDKYKNKGDINLYDIVNLCHPKSKNIDKLMKGELKPAVTWEKKLSAGESKNSTFTELLKEGKLGTKALLMNVRNMIEGDVDQTIIVEALGKANYRGIFPYEVLRTIRALKNEPKVTPELFNALSEAAKKGFSNLPLEGKTAILSDTSASMGVEMSERSDITYTTLGCMYGALAAAQGGVFYTRATDIRKVPYMVGDNILRTIHEATKVDVGWGTNLQQAIDCVKEDYDTVIVFSDMQLSDLVTDTGNIKKIYAFDLSGYAGSISLKGNMIDVGGFSDKMFQLCKDLTSLKDIVKEIDEINL